MRALLGGLLVALSVGACSGPPSVDEILVRVDAIPEPTLDSSRVTDPQYMERFRHEQHATNRIKADALLEVRRLHHDDPRFAALMNRRWELLSRDQDPRRVAPEVLEDIDRLLEVEHDPDVARHAAYWRAFYEAQLVAPDAAAMRRKVQPFIERYPDDDRDATLLDLVATAEAQRRADS